MIRRQDAPLAAFDGEDLAPAPAPAAHVFAQAPDRLVFFFSGFDPKGATFYHRLFRVGAAQRNATHDERLTVGSRHRLDSWAAGWTVLWRATGDDRHPTAATMRNRVHFMRWDDIVRQYWKRGPLRVASDYWNVYARGLFDGIFVRVRRKAPAAFWLSVFPLGVALASVGGLATMTATCLHLLAALPTGIGLAVGLVIGMVAWRLIVRRIDCEWLLRLYAFTRQQALGELPILEAREDAMALHLVETVEARLRQTGAAPLREILLVGYSTGSIVAAAVAARALTRLERALAQCAPEARPELAMLTLGHCIPVAADWRGAERTRAELRQLAACPALTWHDYSSPADWAAFWRTPPWPEPAKLRGLQASPRFHALLSPAEYEALRRDRREMHLQYLRAPGRRADAAAYDYFSLVCGPTALAQRPSLLRRAGGPSPQESIEA